MIEGYRKMSAGRKLQIMQDLINAACILALGDIKRTHPEANRREMMLRLASRRIEPELVRKAFGWDPEVEGYCRLLTRNPGIIQWIIQCRTRFVSR